MPHYVVHKFRTVARLFCGSKTGILTNVTYFSVSYYSTTFKDPVLSGATDASSDVRRSPC
jgi:hypothetical protein